MDRIWLSGRELKSSARYRLFCFPYAGGSAAVYWSWQRAMPDHIEVCAVELPGRGCRSREAPLASLPLLVKELAASLADDMDRPFALFGHSMGGLVAFELARTLHELGAPRPIHVFISAMAAPGIARRGPTLHDATESDIRHRLREVNGMPKELLADEELMALMMPELRADFAVLETYEYQPGPPLDMPISVFGGLSDLLVSPEALARWGGHCAAGATFRLFPGDHFYLHSAVGALTDEVAHVLG
jgi:medium-chain acyl-[acyl-carrier-protein] hydrolase